MVTESFFVEFITKSRSFFVFTKLHVLKWTFFTQQITCTLIEKTKRFFSNYHTHIKGEVFVNTTKAHKRSSGVAPLIFKLSTTALCIWKKERNWKIWNTHWKQRISQFFHGWTFIAETPKKLLMSNTSHTCLRYTTHVSELQALLVLKWCFQHVQTNLPTFKRTYNFKELYSRK